MPIICEKHTRSAVRAMFSCVHLVYWGISWQLSHTVTQLTYIWRHLGHSGHIALPSDATQLLLSLKGLGMSQKAEPITDLYRVSQPLNFSKTTQTHEVFSKYWFGGVWIMIDRFGALGGINSISWLYSDVFQLKPLREQD